jgi:hypothetical protein
VQQQQPGAETVAATPCCTPLYALINMAVWSGAFMLAGFAIALSAAFLPPGSSGFMLIFAALAVIADYVVLLPQLVLIGVAGTTSGCCRYTTTTTKTETTIIPTTTTHKHHLHQPTTTNPTMTTTSTTNCGGCCMPGPPCFFDRPLARTGILLLTVFYVFAGVSYIMLFIGLPVFNAPDGMLISANVVVMVTHCLGFSAVIMFLRDARQQQATATPRWGPRMPAVTAGVQVQPAVYQPRGRRSSGHRLQEPFVPAQQQQQLPPVYSYGTADPQLPQSRYALEEQVQQQQLPQPLYSYGTADPQLPQSHDAKEEHVRVVVCRLSVCVRARLPRARACEFACTLA